MKTLFPQLETTRRLLQSTGPYLLLELLLPGGTLFALLLWLYRRKGGRKGQMGPRAPGRWDRVTRRLGAPFDGYAWTRRLAPPCQRADDGLEALGFVPGCATQRGSRAARRAAPRDPGHARAGGPGCVAAA